MCHYIHTLDMQTEPLFLLGKHCGARESVSKMVPELSAVYECGREAHVLLTDQQEHEQ